MDSPHINLGRRPSTFDGFLAAMAAMLREVKMKTLEGGDLTVEVMPTSTIEELKAMLLAMLFRKKHCEDPIERRILKVKVLADGLLVDDDQTVESAGLLNEESEVTVMYHRNEVEAATKETIHAEGLLQVNIPSSLTEIPTGAFQDCNQVLTVAIPDSVRAIGVNAFHSCHSLESIKIPESVTDIQMGAFANCYSLKRITIPQSVRSIRVSAFQNCTSLESIVIPESLRTISRTAFEGCKSLASITIPESVTSIGDFAFYCCSSLESITIPESLREDGKRAFDGKLQGIIQHV